MRTRTSALLLASFVASAAALRVPFRRESANRASAPIRFNKRQSTADFGFTNLDNEVYVGTIYVDGVPFEVQLDTGSSDLWLDPSNATFPSAQTDTNVTGLIGYGDGTVATGPILLANVTFGNWTVEKQAYISAVGTNATSLGDAGLLGVGPPLLSAVDTSLNGTSYDGSSFLEQVFKAYPDLPNQITFLLTREAGAGTTGGGVFTISTVEQGGLEAVSSSPKLEVFAPEGNQWLTLMSGAVINGTLVQGNSSIVQSDSSTVALLDTGTAQAEGPQYYVDAIYSSIEGAEFHDGNWLFLCENAYFNVSLIFGDTAFFVHPIDLSTPSGVEDGAAVCSGTFTGGVNDGTDWILGDSFLRNVYSLYDFGNWTSAGDGNPFMQIFSVTNEQVAYQEFPSLNQQRIQALLAADSNSTSSSSLSQGSSSSSTDVSASSVVPSSSIASGDPSSSPSPSGSSTPASSPSDTSPGSTASIPSSTSGSSSPSGDKESISGAVASDDSTTVDLTPLNRNSYIIMGLIGVAILLLLVNIVLGSKKNKGYRQVGAPGSAPTHGGDRSYTDKYED